LVEDVEYEIAGFCLLRRRLLLLFFMLGGRRRRLLFLFSLGLNVKALLEELYVRDQTKSKYRQS